MQGKESQSPQTKLEVSDVQPLAESELCATGSSLRYSQNIASFDESTHYGRLLQLVGRNKRVLELGSSTGYLTDAMQSQFDCNVLGIEIDREAAAISQARGNEVLQLDLDVVDLFEVLHGRKFDVVLCADVLEHLRNPERVLRACYELLEEDGSLVASIPNAAHADVRLALLGGQLPFRSMGLLDNTHVKFFTRASIEELFEAACFRVDTVSRNRWGISKTEVQPNLSARMVSLERLLMHDPESETYQFIVSCRKYHPSEKLQLQSGSPEEELESVDIVLFETGYQRADDKYQKLLTLINFPSALLSYWVASAGGLRSLKKLVSDSADYADNDFRTFSFVKHSSNPATSIACELLGTDSDVVIKPLIVVDVLNEIARKSTAKYLFLLESGSLPAANCLQELVNKARLVEAEGKGLPIVLAKAELTLPVRLFMRDEQPLPHHGFSGLLVPRSYVINGNICDRKLLTTTAQAQDMCLRAKASHVNVLLCPAATYFSNGSRICFGISEQMQDSLRMSRRWGSFRDFASTVKYWFKQYRNSASVLWHSLAVALIKGS